MYIKIIQILVTKEWIDSTGILFGSYARGTPVKSSDIDILIILPNSTSRYEIKRLKYLLSRIHLTLFPENLRSSTFSIFRLVEQSTGQFVSGFVCTKADFLSGNFPQIFRVSWVAAQLLAPKTLVLRNFQLSSRTLWGENLIGKIKVKQPTNFDLAISMCMNILLITGTFFISPMYLIYKGKNQTQKQITKTCMEAVKWSLHSIAAWKAINFSSEQIARQILIKPKTPELIRNGLIHFLELRKSNSDETDPKIKKQGMMLLLKTLPLILYIPWVMKLDEN